MLIGTCHVSGRQNAGRFDTSMLEYSFEMFTRAFAAKWVGGLVSSTLVMLLGLKAEHADGEPLTTAAAAAKPSRAKRIGRDIARRGNGYTAPSISSFMAFQDPHDTQGRPFRSPEWTPRQYGMS